MKSSSELDSELLFILSECFRIIGSFQKVIDGDIEVISEFNECSIVCFSFATFIATDAILIHR